MSETTLSGYRVLAIVTNYGVEQDGLVVPVEHLRGRGATVVVAAASRDAVQPLVGDKDPGRTVQPARRTATRVGLDRSSSRAAH